MARYDKNGHNIGKEYAAACLESWLASGFRPVTINSAFEDPSWMVDQGMLEQRKLSRDAQSDYGKPLPYLSDILKEMKRACSGVVALTNADIVVNLSPEDQAALGNLPRGEFVISKRTEVAELSLEALSEHWGGYDFFAFHAEDLPDLDTDILVFGQPWWDHFLPVYLLLSGLKARTIRKGSILHLQHEERWDREKHLSIGRQFVPLLKETLPETFLDSEISRHYFSRAEGKPSPYLLKHRLRDLRRKLTRHGRKKTLLSQLHRLGNMNIDMVDGWEKFLESQSQAK